MPRRGDRVLRPAHAIEQQRAIVEGRQEEGIPRIDGGELSDGPQGERARPAAIAFGLGMERQGNAVAEPRFAIPPGAPHGGGVMPLRRFVAMPRQIEMAEQAFEPGVPGVAALRLTHRALGLVQPPQIRGRCRRQGARSLTIQGGLEAQIPARSGEIVLWDAATGTLLRTIKGHRDYVYQAAFSPPGALLLATSSYDKSIRLWDVSTGIEKATLREHTDAVFPVAFSPDGKRLASGAGDRTVKVWDVSSGKRLFTLSDSLDTVYALAFHPSGRQLSAAGADKMIRTWDLAGQDGTLAFSTIAHEDAIVQLVYSADGRWMVTAAADRRVKVWDVEKRTELRVLTAQSDWPTALALHGQRLAVGRYDGSVSLYDLASGRLQADLLKPAAPTARAAGAYGTGRSKQ